MAHGKYAKRPRRTRQASLFGVAVILSGVLVAGCGGNSTASSTGTASTSGAAVAAHTSTTSARSTADSADPPSALAFAKCMRANGVPNFPDPLAGGGLTFNAAGINVGSPAVKAAQAKCGKLLPAPGSGASSFPPAETAKALTRLRQVAQCMRQHGVEFPDPTPTRPNNVTPGSFSEVTDYEGAFLLFPAGVDMQSPAWQQAAAACGSFAESFTHPHP